MFSLSRGLTKIFSKAKVDKFQITCCSVDDDVFCFQISVYNSLIMQILQQNQCLRCKILDILELNADLFFLVLIERQTVDRLHKEVDMLLAFKSRIEFWEA